MRNLQILCFHECFLVRRNLLLIEEKNSYTVKRDKRDVLCIQERMYSIGFPFREHYFVTTSMSKLRVTEKRCKVLLQLNSIAEAYHYKESINTKMARAKKKRQSEKNICTLILSTSCETPLYSIISEVPFVLA